MQVALTGASGLIGTALKQSLLRDGHQVRVLVRHPTSRDGDFSSDSWDPTRGLLDPNFIADCDAIVCLSGVGVGEHRWTEDYKRQIRQSRVDAVGTVARSLAEYGGPRVLVCASAVGYYGDTGDRTIDESAPPGDSFLAGVCVDWEAAADPARSAGVRVAHMRSGLVLARAGGLLKRLAPIVKLGVAGRLGDGRQYMSWISITDEVAAIRFLLDHDIAGPVNLTAPTPVTNADFTRTLGAVVGRPTVLPVPGFAARTALGEFAGELLTGQRAVPARLTEAGFAFARPDLTAALRAELN
ncbi:MAG TPA: TIGR01777 family oxidoreductase [Jatrophihabitans sp.]|nr:TIGR01777 family oxidoreductase [Jatrophihabitans sp.]